MENSKLIELVMTRLDKLETKIDKVNENLTMFKIKAFGFIAILVPAIDFIKGKL